MFRDYEIRRYIGGTWFGSLTNEEVLAWMPLPEPPVIGGIMTKDEAGGVD